MICITIFSLFSYGSARERLHQDLLDLSLSALLDQVFYQLQLENPDISKSDLAKDVQKLEEKLNGAIKDVNSVTKKFLSMSLKKQESFISSLNNELDTSIFQWQDSEKEQSFSPQQTNQFLKSLFRFYILHSFVIIYSKRQTQLNESLIAITSLMGGLGAQVLSAAGSSANIIDPETALPIFAAGWASMLYGFALMWLEDPYLKPGPESPFYYLNKTRPMMPIIGKRILNKAFDQSIRSHHYIRLSQDVQLINLTPPLPVARKLSSWARSELDKAPDDFKSRKEFVGLSARYYLEALRRMSGIKVHKAIRQLDCSQLFETE